MSEHIRLSTNWTLDGLPIEEGFKVADVVDEEESTLVDITATRRTASKVAADDGPEADEQETCEAVVDWDKPGANGRILCGEPATHSLELNGHTYNYCQHHRDLFMESAGRNSIAKDVKEKEIGEKKSSIALRYALGPCTDCAGFGCMACSDGMTLHASTPRKAAKVAADWEPEWSWALYYDDRERSKRKWKLIENTTNISQGHKLDANSFEDALAEAIDRSGVPAEEWEIGINQSNGEQFARAR